MVWSRRSIWVFVAWILAGFPCRAIESTDNSEGIFVPIAEEVLDAAIEHCRLGQALQAQALFAAILEQLDPPQSIRELILAISQDGCSGKPTNPGRWELRASAGYDDNVTQGIRRSSVSLGTDAQSVELVLDQSYSPVSSGYLEVAGAHVLKTTDHTALQVGAGGRQYNRVRAYDLAHVNAVLKSRADPFGWPVDWAMEWTELWMGGRRYHTAWAMATQAPAASAGYPWSYAAIAQKIIYHTQPQQNATQFQLGLSRQLRLGTGKALALGVMGIWDHAMGQRAGGTRAGATFHATAQVKHHSWLLTGRMSMTHWASRQDFLPGLVDAKRRNNLLQISAQAEIPLSESQTLQLELQMRESRDTIALYTYRSSGLGISWIVRY